MAANESSSQNESLKLTSGYAEVIPMPRVAASDSEALAIFSKIAKLLLDPGDLKHTFDQFTQHAVELSGAEFGGYFYNDDNAWGLLSLVGAKVEDFQSFGQPRITPLFKTTYDGTEIIWSDDITADARFGQMGGMPGGHITVRSYLAVPVMKSRGVVHGTLLLGHSQPGRFNDKIASRIGDVASMAQVALERESRESEAREARDMLTAITETAPMPIYVKNLKGEITYANPATVAAIGLPKDQIIGHAVGFYAEEAAAATNAIDERILSGEQITVIKPVTFMAGDGVRRTMLSHKTAMHGRDGQISGIVAVASDVTELTRHQAALVESERLHRELLDSLPVALYTTDNEGTITYYNQAAVDLAGFTPLDAQKWSVAWKLLDANDEPMEHNACPMAEAIRTKKPVRNKEAKAIRPDGKIISFIPHPTLLHDSEGNINGAVNVLVDITERRAMEERLRESEDHYRHVIELTPHVSWTCDPDGTITSYSSKWNAITGQGDEALVDGGWQRALHPSDVSRYVDDLHVAMATGNPLDSEFRLLDQGHNDYRWFRSRAYPRRDKTGKIIRWYGVMEDVHEHYQDRERLRISDERFALATNAAKIGVWDWEPLSGRVVWNEQQAALFGRSLDEFDGTIGAWSSMIVPDDRVKVQEDCEKFFAQQLGEFEFGYRVVRPDGQLRHICAIARAFYEQNEPVRVVGTCTDITERTVSRQALADSERRLQATYESAGVGISEVDTTGRYLRTNSAWTKLTGRAVEDYAGKTFFDFIDNPLDRVETKALFDKVVKGELGSFTRQRSYTRTNGKVWWAEITTSAVRDDKNRFLYAVRVSQNITERRQQEEEERLLMGELNHRVKNTLATIQSLFRQSLKATDSLDAFEESFLGRLHALEATHAVLMKTNWAGGASLADVLRAELAPFHGEKSLRWTGFGPPIILNTSAAVYLGLILHELATNAVKYGSLGNDGGQLNVMWHLYEEAKGAEYLRITWTESDGPAVVAPGKPGFGSKLLQSISRQFGGQVAHTYDPTGVEAVIEIPTATIYKSLRDPNSVEKSFAGTQ